MPKDAQTRTEDEVETPRTYSHGEKVEKKQEVDKGDHEKVPSGTKGEKDQDEYSAAYTLRTQEDAHGRTATTATSLVCIYCVRKRRWEFKDVDRIAGWRETSNH